MLATPVERTGTYESPALVELGTLQELTLSCPSMDKKLGSSDGWTFMGQPVTCNSA
jgi:hypothetical protein